MYTFPLLGASFTLGAAPQGRAEGAENIMKRAFGLIATAAAVIALAGCSGGSTWKASVVRYAVINPADLSVVVEVTNTGSSPATPTCMVQASDQSGAYMGTNEATLASPVAAGQTTRFAEDVTITNQGASFVSEAKVSCTG